MDASGRTITAVDHVAGTALAVLTLSTALDGNLGSDTLAPSTSKGPYDMSGIYDQIGNRLPPTPVTITSGDATAPTMTITNPTSGASGVSVNSPLTFTLADAESGVLWSSLTVSITGSKGYSASFTSTSPQIARTGSAASYNVTIAPTTSYSTNETITVNIGATDVIGNCLAAPAWTFTTTVASVPVTISLYPSGSFASTPATTWTVSPLNTWASALDAIDTSYVQGTATATTFTMDLDNPPSSFGGAVQSIVIHAVTQVNSGSGTYPFTLGWRVGASGASASASVNVSGTTWSNVSVNVPLGTSLGYADIVALQAFVTRSTTGTHTDRVDQLWAEVTYLP